MTPKEMTDKLTKLEKAVLRNKREDIQIKYEVLTLFKQLKKLISYQVPTPPIDVSEDGHKFECPRCGTKFDSEDSVEDFNLCYICGQRWKDEESK